MTYLESYLNSKTPKEFKEKLEKDIRIARFINTDRLQAIENAINKAVESRPEFGSVIESVRV